MRNSDRFNRLQFPCECVSSAPGNYSDPWAAISKNKLLPDGTKEQILNLLGQGPKTISQMAETLGLAVPSVYTHVRDMLESELLRDAVEWEKTHPAERYYEPNFPVIDEEECRELCELCDELADKFADLFKRYQRRLKRSFDNTSVAQRGWEFASVAQCAYARVQRAARERLERDGTLAPSKMHQNGAKWVFWAMQPGTTQPE